MQNASYIVQKFSENFSEITTITQLSELVKAQKFKLEVDLIHRTPSILTWCPAEDAFSGEYRLLIYPRISIEGKNFAPSKMVPLKLPSQIGNFEDSFIESLKQAIRDIKQVWN